MLAVVLAFSTGCSFLLAEKPGPKCEESGADIADTTTAVIAGLTGLLVSIGAAECLSRRCSGEGAAVFYGGTAGLVATTALFAASAVHGSNYNAACRRARQDAYDAQRRPMVPAEDGPS